jgi:hypothetical protein
MSRHTPPAWFVAVTAVFTLVVLVMAVAETSLWTHYLIDRGEFLCLGGLLFALGAGVHLHRTGRLGASLPLFVPWLLYPVVTQGDQIIDNLTIGGMRLFAHAVLLVLFLAPLGVAAAGSQSLRRPPWIAALLLLEIGIAHRYLGAILVGLLVATLIVYLGFVLARRSAPRSAASGVAGGRAALSILVAGIALSLALYLGYKHRPGAYQGSPHHFHDPFRPDQDYSLDRVPLPVGEATPLPTETVAEARAVLTSYGEALEKLLGAYYVLDRNYNYAFHNALFLRETPVVPGFRAKALDAIADARREAEEAGERRAGLGGAVACSHPLSAFLDEVARFSDFQFERARLLEEMSGTFEKTEAGLQHATHLYEGEGKVLGIRLAQVVRKHRLLLERSDFAGVTSPFVEAAARIEAKYAERIVGF